MACLMCEKKILDDSDKGLLIRNFCIENFPDLIEVCRNCTERFQVGLMTGTSSIGNFVKLFQSLKKGKKT